MPNGPFAASFERRDCLQAACRRRRRRSRGEAKAASPRNKVRRSCKFVPIPPGPQPSSALRTDVLWSLRRTSGPALVFYLLTAEETPSTIWVPESRCTLRFEADSTPDAAPDASPPSITPGIPVL